ncbi:MAG: hypothetical protein WB586_03885 [Chthoniobacterales bacterium]
MARPERGISVKDLYGGRFISPEATRKSMAGLEERLTAQFKDRVRLRTQLAEQTKKYGAAFVELVSKDKGAAEAVKEMRRLQTVAREHKVKSLPVEKVQERIFTASIGATVGPPYDYQWTWSAVAGNPGENSEAADNNSGNMSINIWTDFGGNSSSVSGRAAVGTYFYPPANGSLQIWSSPAFNDDWGDWCNFDSAHTDGWIGLYVGSYDLTGAPTGAVVDQQVTLWSDDSWWSGTGEQTGSNSAFGLYAPPIQVDQDHQYEIWVWCGGDVSAAGWGTFSGSGAGDDLSVSVASITWELG